MSRTTRDKLGYLLALLGLGGVAWWLVRATNASPLAMLGIAAVLLIPGRVQGHYYRDLYRGRRLLGERRFAEALPFLERFLRDIRARPGLKHLIWPAWGTYTRDVEVMALTNLGACHLELGQLEGRPIPRGTAEADV